MCPDLHPNEDGSGSSFLIDDRTRSQVTFLGMPGSRSSTLSLSSPQVEEAYAEQFFEEALAASRSLQEITAFIDDPWIENRLRNLRLAYLVESWLVEDLRDGIEPEPDLGALLAENPLCFDEHKES